MLIELAAAGVGKLFYDVNKSLKMDEEAKAKYAKAFTKECEAQRMVELKKEYADKRLENVAKKKKAVINVSLPMFVDIYKQIQQVNIIPKERTFDIIKISDAQGNSIIQHADIISKKEFTGKELILGTIFKGIPGMIVEDSKRNLSAARSQMRAANVVEAQAQSLAEFYDALSERADRISGLIANMNAMFIGSLSEVEKILTKNGTVVSNYSEYEKGVITICVNMAVAMTKIIDIPVLDDEGRIAEAACEMIRTGEEYLSKFNKVVNEG